MLTGELGDLATLLERVECFYDAVPRLGALAEPVGPFVVFRPGGKGWPYYVRPALGATEFTAEAVGAARARRRELGLEESFEWVHDVSPGLHAAAVAGGLHVHDHPLLVLTSPQAASTPDGVTIERVDADTPDLASVLAVADVAFGHPGTASGDVGAAARDLAAAQVDVSKSRGPLEAGWMTTMVARSPEGPLAVGSAQRAGDVVEIVGVATLPAARRRGLAAAVTAALIDHVIAAGADVVFLSADDDDVARIYAGLGFERVATACIAEPPATAG